MANRRVIKYPIEFNNGRIVLSQDPGAELDLLLDYPPGRRTLLIDYGIDSKLLLQSSIDQLRISTIILVEMRDKFKRFIRNTELVSARLFKKREKPRTIFAQVLYKEKNEEKNKQFEINSL